MNTTYKAEIERLQRERYAEIINALIAKGHNKSAIAAKLGTYNHIVNDIQNGKRGFTTVQIWALRQFYNVNPAYFFENVAQAFKPWYENAKYK